MSFDWTAHKFGASHDFVKFETEGDSITGHIVTIREHTFDPDRGPVPLLDMERSDGEIVTLSADKVDLRQQLADLEPQVGDKLRVTFTGWEKIPGSGNKKKVFEIQHKVGERRPVEEAPPEYEPGEEPF